MYVPIEGGSLLEKNAVKTMLKTRVNLELIRNKMHEPKEGRSRPGSVSAKKNLRCYYKHAVRHKITVENSCASLTWESIYYSLMLLFEPKRLRVD